MHSVNNGLNMSNMNEAIDIALDKIKNILISFEKKKRNLEKRKNKLDEYKKKADLNEDQQAAVNKYPEVISNLELLEELTSHAVQQLKDAEKSIKKIKKQEKVDKKRSESQLSEFVLKNYSVLERVGSNESLKRKLTSEGVATEKEIDAINEMFQEMHLSDKGDWKHYSEHLYALYEAANKHVETLTQDEKSTPKEDFIAIVGRISKVEWLWFDELEECVTTCVHNEDENVVSAADEEVVQCEPEPIVEECVPHKEPSSPVTKVIGENPKLSFVFLHDSMVQQDAPKSNSENGYNRLGTEAEVRPSSQTSGGNSNNTWQTQETDNTVENVEDVFSSATQSEFMHSENIKNAWTKNMRTPLNERFKSRPNVHASFGNKEGTTAESNFWKPSRGAFNSNPRFMRPSRGRGRGRGSARDDNPLAAR